MTCRSKRLRRSKRLLRSRHFREMLHVYKTQAKTNQGLINGLKKYSILFSKSLARAMSKIDRGDFADRRRHPYYDHPSKLSYGAPISAPHIHVWAMEQVMGIFTDPMNKHVRVLDIGCGSGYVTALMAQLVKDRQGSKVIGIDCHEDAVKLSKRNIGKNHQDFLDKGLVVIKQGDGWQGSPEDGPFDVIHVGAGAEEVPHRLVEQLKPGGRIVMPVGQYPNHKMNVVEKKADGTTVTDQGVVCRFVPLVKG